MFTSILTWLISKALPFIWARFKHLAVYIAILLIIGMVAMKFNAFKLDLYNTGYKAGYKQSGIDHPTFGNVGNVNNISGYDLYGLSVDGWGIGIVKQHRNK